MIHQSCWNHETREAVCRCPECGRSYCRECITEHAARLLCAACLHNALAVAKPGRSAGRVGEMLLLIGGLLLSWLMFLGVAGGVSEYTARLEQTAWQNCQVRSEERRGG